MFDGLQFIWCSGSVVVDGLTKVFGGLDNSIGGRHLWDR